MPDTYYQSSSNFPQTSQNRTRSQAATELLDYVGGANRPEAETLGGRVWDAAVREFNTCGWRFNRRSQDITLVANTKTYSLNEQFRSPYRAAILDSSSVEQWQLMWVPHEIWFSTFSGSQSGSGLADYYTIFNAHNQGTVRLEPYPSGTLTYPTLRVQYLCNIQLATGNNDRLNVPMEVDEAIFQLAAATLRDRTRGDAGDLFARAKLLRLDCEREHRDWPEPTGWGANG